MDTHRCSRFSSASACGALTEIRRQPLCRRLVALRYHPVSYQSLGGKHENSDTWLGIDCGRVQSRRVFLACALRCGLDRNPPDDRSGFGHRPRIGACSRAGNAGAAPNLRGGCQAALQRIHPQCPGHHRLHDQERPHAQRAMSSPFYAPKQTKGQARELRFKRRLLCC